VRLLTKQQEGVVDGVPATLANQPIWQGQGPSKLAGIASAKSRGCRLPAGLSSKKGKSGFLPLARLLLQEPPQARYSAVLGPIARTKLFRIGISGFVCYQRPFAGDRFRRTQVKRARILYPRWAGLEMAFGRLDPIFARRLVSCARSTWLRVFEGNF